jgi:hypothetical protein
MKNSNKIKLLLFSFTFFTITLTNFYPLNNTNNAIFTSEVLDQQGSGDAKALADINGDGKMDPILGGSSLGWFEKDSSWNFHVIIASPPYQEFSTDMQAEDIDGDGDPDIIVGDAGGIDNLLWFENPRIDPPAGSGTDPRIAANWVYHIIGTHGDWVHDIEIGDLDNDGKVDVVSSGHGHSHIWKNELPADWVDITMLNAGKGVYIGDVNDDGWKDIATPSGWLANPTTSLSDTWVYYPIAVTASNDEVLLADINNDSKLDLITIDAHNSSEFAWYESPADPTSSFWVKTIIDGAMGAHKIEAADFNNDGFVDILSGLELADLSIYFNSTDSLGNFTKQQLDTKAAHNARAGDIDNDGDIDVFGADYINHPPAIVYLNESAIPVELTNFSFDIVDGKIVLKWTTATEINNSHFIVQRSPDKINFIDLDRIEGSGTKTEISNYSFTDESAGRMRHYYRLKQVDFDGSFSYSKIIKTTFFKNANTYFLFQNYPNPFNPKTVIKYSIPEASNVQIKVYDMLGGEVADLVNEMKEAGTHEVGFDASELSSGIYIYSIQSGDFVQTMKMTLLR